MKHRFNLLTIMVACALLAACAQPNLSFREVKDSEMTVQLMKLEAKDNADAALTYKARLIPVKKLMEAKNDDAQTALLYRMDSCFYLQSNGKKIYASMVQPVQNGVSGTFEYLLEFERAAISGKGLRMIYKDKYINQHTYSLLLNKN